MTPTREWYDCIAPATMSLDCSGREHFITWERGALLLHQHHDADAERVLAALGGDVPVCVQVLDAWERSLASRDAVSIALDWGARNRLSRPIRMGGHPRWWFTYGFSPAKPRRWDLIEQLPEEVRDRYVLTAVQRDPGETVGGLARQVLEAKASPLLMTSAMVCTQTTGLFDIQVRPVTERSGASLVTGFGRGRFRLEVRLPPSWLWSVWGRGVALVDNHFVLEVLDDRHASRLRVRAVNWDRLMGRRPVPATRTATIDLDERSWRASWED